MSALTVAATAADLAILEWIAQAVSLSARERQRQDVALKQS
ncbi:hypothetical protein QTI33_32960 [Variovorax sp. J22P271]|nr:MULTISPECIES: hypothetical protein [unclassified Variovorax]MDM0036985.1 hypothetical protein [Variovorax sp. J22P271]MDM0109441.1 hypothetical protein [Variovorax sp. J22R24]